MYNRYYIIKILFRFY